MSNTEYFVDIRSMDNAQPSLTRSQTEPGSDNVMMWASPTRHPGSARMIMTSQ
jgi:hypothetical protein